MERSLDFVIKGHKRACVMGIDFLCENKKRVKSVTLVGTVFSAIARKGFVFQK